MIYDHIDNFNKYRTIFDEDANVFDSIEKLKMNFISSSMNLFEYVLSPAPSLKDVFENHKENIDIHFILEGTEKFLFANITDCTVTSQYDKEGDFQLYSSCNFNEIEVSKGHFIIFFPDEAHSPKHYVDNRKVMRVVIKSFINCNKE